MAALQHDREWNLDQALLNAEHDREFLLELIDIWEQQEPELMESLRISLLDERWKFLLEVVHKLKGSLQVIAADTAYDAACALEAAGRVADRFACEAILADLTTALASLQIRLSHWKAGEYEKHHRIHHPEGGSRCPM